MKEYFNGFDEKSFNLGMIEAFCEIVMQEVKPLALSPVIEPADWEIIKRAAEKTALGFGVKSYKEMSLISTDLAEDKDVIEKVVILYYKDDKVLNKYLDLKSRAERLKVSGSYDEIQKREVSVSFRELLGYSQNAINKYYQQKERGLKYDINGENHSNG